MLFNFSESIGSGWQLVRHAPPGKIWHWATDNLLGTDVYGNYVPDMMASSAFSVAFQDKRFNEFLFMTGDQSVWLRAPSLSVYGSYTSKPRSITCSSGRTGSYQARWTNRGKPEHPFIGVMDDHFPANNVQYDGALLYAESGYTFDTELLGKGANVFIRFNTGECAFVCARSSVHF